MSAPKNNKRKKGPVHRHTGREIALQFLFQCDFSDNSEKSFSDKEFDFFLEQAEQIQSSSLSEKDFRRAVKFAGELVKGYFANFAEIDRKIADIAEKWDFSRIAPIEKNIMRISAYEMLYRMDIPPIVSINEAVELCKSFTTGKAAHFVNGILNKIKDGLSRSAREALK